VRKIGLIPRDLIPGPSQLEVHATLLRLVAKAMRTNNPALLEETARLLEERAKA
jgi:hypothetical protein